MRDHFIPSVPRVEELWISGDTNDDFFFSPKTTVGKKAKKPLGGAMN